MEILYNVFLMLHITAGFMSLISGLVAIIARKGKKYHLVAGRIFYFSMLLVAVSAILISVYKSNSFLFFIGIFAFFQDYTGYRSIKNKSLIANRADWLVLLIAGINSVLMLVSLNTVLMVFGGISSFMVIGEVRLFMLTARGKPIPKMQWLVRHLSMMLGAYIATTTAFVVVNVKSFEPAWLPWLLPTFVITPIIVYYTRKYSLKNK